MLRKTLFAASLSAAAVLTLVPSSRAVTASWSQPDLDRWMYPFNFTPGTRAVGSLFGSAGSATFDDRGAQILVGFDTSTRIATGLAPTDYHITKVTVTATVSAGSFQYDPTYDSFATYEAGGVDGDVGRPIELFGVGFRGGYTALDFGNADLALPPGFAEAENFGSHNGNPGTFDQDRSAFALGENAGVLVDVSNNVKQTFDTTPWAVGMSAALTPGDDVLPDTTFTFELDLSDPLVLAYLRAGLSEGQLGFTLTSMHQAAQTGPVVYPIFYMDEHLTGQPMTLDIEYTTGQTGGGGGGSAAMPEPTTMMLLAMSVAMVAAPRRRRNR